MRLKRIVLWALGLAVAGGLVWGGATLLKRRSAALEESAAPSYTVAVQRGDLVASIAPTGEVYAPRSAELTVDVTRLPVIEVNVVPGEQVTQGEVLARIDPSSLQRAVDQAKANLLSAEDALEEAKSPYTALDRQRAGLEVAQAATALAEARGDLEELESPDLEKAQEAVDEATRDLGQARDDLTALKNDTAPQKEIEDLQYAFNEAQVAHGVLLEKGDTSEKGQDSLLVAYNAMMDAQEALESAKLQAELSLLAAEHEVQATQDTLSDAREALDGLRAGASALEMAQARDAVAQAEYDLAEAQAGLDEIDDGPDENDIRSAEATYEAAVAALAEAEATLGAADVAAPFDGTVVSVGVEAGDLVSAGTVIVTLADLTELRIEAAIDETEISQVKAGQDVTITFDAFAGYTFQGKVLEVPLQGTLSNNIVTYAVPISLEGTEGVAIKSGMTANLAIIVGRVEGALLVPILAVQQGDSGDVVLVPEPDGTTVETPVEVGLGNGTYVEVLRGLNEGDQVVVVYDTPEDDSGFGFVFEFGGEMPPDGALPGGGAMPGGGAAPPGGGSLP